MRVWIGGIILFLTYLSVPASAQKTSTLDVSAGYSYVRSNAPPGGCGCFSLNGADVSAAYNLTSHLGVAGDFSYVRARNINGSNQGLTLVSYLFGPQYSVTAGSRFTPFVHVLAGGIHASGLGYGSSSAPSNAFGALLGGGLDWRLKPRISVRLFEADYYLTHFQNDVNSHQNNLKLVFGVVFHFGGK